MPRVADSISLCVMSLPSSPSNWTQWGILIREEHFFFYWVQISPGIFFFSSRKIAESRRRDGSCVEFADVFIHSFTKYLLSTYCVLGTVLRAGSSSGEREGQFLPFIVIIFLCVGETVDV